MTACFAGSGSVWSNRSTLYVGWSGAGNSLVISNGGAVFNSAGIVGFAASGSNKVVTVGGNGARWVNSAICTLATLAPPIPSTS